METFKGKKFNELLEYVDFFTEGKKPPFFQKKNDKENKKVEDKKTKKASPVKDKKSGKGKLPPGLAAYNAKKKGGKNGGKSKD